MLIKSNKYLYYYYYYGLKNGFILFETPLMKKGVSEMFVDVKIVFVVYLQKSTNFFFF
jgi:hypothetical protein